MPLLVGGDYSVVLTLNSYEGRVFDRHERALPFTVVDRSSRSAKYEGWDIGPVMSPLLWSAVEATAEQSSPAARRYV